MEVLNEDGTLKCKADMFTKRTIKRQETVTSVDTPFEALAVSMSEKACVLSLIHISYAEVVWQDQYNKKLSGF